MESDAHKSQLRHIKIILIARLPITVIGIALSSETRLMLKFNEDLSAAAAVHERCSLG
jgi:hypothetical protein